jgi:hypothetical protein
MKFYQINIRTLICLFAIPFSFQTMLAQQKVMEKMSAQPLDIATI